MRIADSIKIDTDEGRFVMIVDDEMKGLITYDIHAIALELEAQVRRELRPYALEAEYARMTMPPSYPDDDTGYALDDPKHPTYYERMVD